MKRGLSLGVGLIAAVALAAGGGYWLGKRGERASATPPVAASEGSKQERRILYYRNPMGLPDTSPVPKKDPMGMDYVAVYEGGNDMSSPATGNQIKISTEKVQ